MCVGGGGGEVGGGGGWHACVRVCVCIVIIFLVFEWFLAPCFTELLMFYC